MTGPINTAALNIADAVQPATYAAEADIRSADSAHCAVDTSADDFSPLAAVPYIPGTKKPVTENWTKILPGMYPAVGNHGRVLDAATIVLDVDYRNMPAGKNNPEGSNIFSDLIYKYELPITAEVRTPSGGLHLYFRKNPALKFRRKQSLFPGIDFLSEGAQVGQPGTVLASGGSYAFITQCPFAELPAALIAVLEQRADADESFAQESLTHYEQYKAECESALPAIEGQHGDDTTFQHALRGRDLALPKDAVFQLMRDYWNPRCIPAWSDSELYAKVCHAYAYAKNAPGSATPEAKFLAAGLIAPPATPATAESVKVSTALNDWQSRWPLTGVYRRDPQGVNIEGKQDLCGHVAVTARMRGINGADEGLALEVLTADNATKKFYMSKRRVHDPKNLAGDLAAFGLTIVPGKELDFAKFIASCKPEKTIIAVNHTGWISDPEDPEKLIFILPRDHNNPGYYYQPERGGTIADIVSIQGTLDDWNINVFKLIRGNPYAQYEIFKSLAAPLLRFADAGANGEHLKGETSCGKTTLMQVGASCWGRGAAPSDDPERSYLRTWYSTDNAVEAVLAQHNDLPIYMDELGVKDDGFKTFGKLIYVMFGGQGKAAMGRQRDLKQCRHWRTILTSTGEISLLSLIESAHGGQLVRFTERNVMRSTFPDAQQVDGLKRACSKYYGTLGPEFVNSLKANYTVSSLSEAVQGLLNEAKQRIRNRHSEFTAAQTRASQRFALAEAAGLLLVKFGLIPGLTSGDVIAAIDAVTEDWIPSSKQIGDIDRALDALREFIVANLGLRFQECSGKQEIQWQGNTIVLLDDRDKAKYRELAGLVDSSERKIYMTKKALTEATRMNPADVAKELADRKMLIREKEGSLQHRVRIGAFQPWLYCFKMSFLEPEPEPSRQACQALTWDDLT